ncbi:hypothetical protein HG536_0C03490 [Torulaspora globosa]|uniref:Uncharacterized protein n=1 Tax=Torulaspora globosa TaxID=48254 RepID=A0A7G3ZF95_9SACH|nr:uncharacterized protein HG536_0C03490 [Torulaspora globosa]QLL32181.1 hypothetical protein HG536_0C03490 [Torulaspora globosa]
MDSNMNYSSFSNKKFTESKIIKFISTLWFVAVKLPIELLKALFFKSKADVGIVPRTANNHQYETMSLTELMTESYLMEDFSPFETSEKYARLYYSPALGLVVSLIVFGTVMRLNFFRKSSHFIVNDREKYKSFDNPKSGHQLDLENIPIEYDEELNSWCTLDCSRVVTELKNDAWVVNDIPLAGLPKRRDNYAALAARSLIFHEDRSKVNLAGAYSA